MLPLRGETDPRQEPAVGLMGRAVLPRVAQLVLTLIEVVNGGRAVHSHAGNDAAVYDFAANPPNAKDVQAPAGGASNEPFLLRPGKAEGGRGERHRGDRHPPAPGIPARARANDR